MLTTVYIHVKFSYMSSGMTNSNGEYPTLEKPMSHHHPHMSHHHPHMTTPRTNKCVTTGEYPTLEKHRNSNPENSKHLKNQHMTAPPTNKCVTT